LPILLGSALVAGCGQSRAHERYIPSEEAAQRTLEMALTAWQNGKQPSGLVQESAPAVHLLDTHHKEGQKLTAFTVLGPTTGDAHRCYAVRLTFEGPYQEVRARFVVFGQDPLWVMRYEDYEMVQHWCAPEGENPAPAPNPKP
jgi:hypothetical protein